MMIEPRVIVLVTPTPVCTLLFGVKLVPLPVLPVLLLNVVTVCTLLTFVPFATLFLACTLVLVMVIIGHKSRRHCATCGQKKSADESFHVGLRLEDA